MSRGATATRDRLRSGAVMAVAMGIMNLTTYGYTVIAAHVLGKEPYGAFSALMGTLLVISVLSLGLQATGARRISAEPAHVVAIERVVLGAGLRSALILGALCLLMAPVINEVLHLDSLPTALLVGVTAFPLTYMGAQLGVLQGERRWGLLALVYLAQGLGRLCVGLGFIIFWPTEFAAMAGVAVGAWLPVAIGALALSRPRAQVHHTSAHPGLELIREVAHSSQALLAFFALSNADILVARATMSNAQAGLYAAGLIMVKAVLFLPQFVVVYAFPSMSKEETNRRTLMLAMLMSSGLGAVAVLAVLVLPDLALLFVGGAEFEPIKHDLWKFAIVGTLLSMIQLLVYSALARRQGRAVIAIWTALALLVAGALAVSTAPSLVLVVVGIDVLLFAALFGVALSSKRPVATLPAEARPAA